MSRSSIPPLRILAIEPWLGGSHRAFLEGWQARSRHAVEIEGLPARHWKWRMRAGAWELARKLGGAPPPRVLVASDFLDLPAFLGFLPGGWSDVPVLCYFHENQLTYPLAAEAPELERDRHYGLMNILCAVCADALVFNSAFHRRDFERGAFELLAMLPRPNPRAELERALAAARVIAPGIDVEAIPLGPGAEEGAPLRVLFNHRWEHDKDPAAFLGAVREARRRGARLELVLCGESFATVPADVAEELRALEETIVHRGFLRSRAEYAEQLGRCDLVISTARHEFFGISVAEAMSAGVTPLLPDRLSYPELVGEERAGEALYRDPTELVERLIELARNPELLRESKRRQRMRAAAERFSLERTAAALDSCCEELVGI